MDRKSRRERNMDRKRRRERERKGAKREKRSNRKEGEWSLLTVKV